MTLLVVRVEHPPGGELLSVRGLAVQQGDGSWSEQEQAEVLLPREQPLLEQARDVVLASADPGVSRPKTGRMLWDVLMAGEVGDWWRREVASSRARGRTVRSVLDVRVPELRSVPWELMSAGQGAPAFRNSTAPWVRAQTPWQPLDAMPVPMRVLMVVGDPDDDDLQVDAELAAVHGALKDVPGRWLVEVLQTPSIGKLRQELEELEPHVLHIVAHGAQKDGEPVLRMSDGTKPWALTREDVAELPTPLPRLVILNACRSAAPATGQDSSWSFTDEFFDAGSAAVLTMQGDVTSTAAVAFSHALYQGLAAGTPVDVACARGRVAIHDRLKDVDDRCWSLPCLSVGADPDHVLPVIVSARDEALVLRSPYLTTFEHVADYVDRSSERRQLWQALDLRHSPSRPRLLFVTGEAGVGKSAVVLSTLLTLRLQGRNVVYVDLDEIEDGERRASWLTILRCIRDAVWDWLPQLPLEPRDAFTHDLHYLQRKRDPLPRSLASALPTNDEFDSVGDDYASWIERIFAAFRMMLTRAAANEPLLVALDGLRRASTTDLELWLSPHLFEPTGRGEWPAVQFMLIGTESELANVSRQAKNLAGAPIPVPPFRGADLPRLAQEFYARLGVTLEGKEWWPHIDQLIRTKQGTISADELTAILRLYKILESSS